MSEIRPTTASSVVARQKVAMNRATSGRVALIYPLPCSEKRGPLGLHPKMASHNGSLTSTPAGRNAQIAVIHLAATRANCPVCLTHRFADVVRDCRLGKELVPKHLCFGEQPRAKLSRALLILVTGHTSIIKCDKLVRAGKPGWP
jgi:hypothetical protein